MEDKRKDPKEKKCAICGKDMYAGEEWVFKRKIGGERMKWFCSYKCMRTWDAKHDGKNAAVITVDEVTAAPKEPTSRAVLAKALVKEIQRGGSVIAYMKAEGYKNPWEAYNSVRHYCETKMPELAEVLKPLKELQKAKPAKVEKVPDIEQLEEQVAEQLNLQGGVNYQLKVDEAVQAEEKIRPEEMKNLLHLYTREDILRIVDKAALDCQQDIRFRWTSESLEREMFNNSQLNAEGIGMMKLRKKIRKMLGAEEDE